MVGMRRYASGGGEGHSRAISSGWASSAAKSSDSNATVSGASTRARAQRTSSPYHHNSRANDSGEVTTYRITCPCWQSRATSGRDYVPKD